MSSAVGAGTSADGEYPPEPGQPTIRVFSISKISKRGAPFVDIHASVEHPFELRSTMLRDHPTGKATLKCEFLAKLGTSEASKFDDHTLVYLNGTLIDGLDSPLKIDSPVRIYVDNAKAAFTIMGNWVTPHLA